MKKEIKEKKEKIILDKQEKKEFIKISLERIEKLGYQLKRHTIRNSDTSHINYKIFHLLTDPFTYVNAYTKISKNRGALTEGYEDDQTTVLFGLDKAEKIAKKVKEGTYKFKPVKRTWVPKPGKTTKRPLDVPTQSDRIVQEAVRGVLEAIYEPEFVKHGEETKDLSNNYGFRPNLSCWSAIDKLKKYSRRCNIVIEGDIVSAYNNVNHDILLKILRKRIRDEKFLKLIIGMLKSGIMDDNRFEHSLNGTPQGGIVSPLLFNIYMLELDRYIYEEFVNPIMMQNEKEGKTEQSSYLYNKARWAVDKTRKEFLKAKEAYETNPRISNKKQLQETKKKYKQARMKRLNTAYGKVERLPKGAVYVRYADDWVLAITATEDEATQIKNKITEFLETQLKMQLDVEKTKITRTPSGYKFLGFEIRLNDVKKPKITKVLSKLNNQKFVRVLKRTTSRQITVEPDSDRILKRLKHLKLCNKDYFPIGRPLWRQFHEYQIVQKYNAMFRGLYNYYRPCQKLQRLSHISYILHYSCAKTIAGRQKTSISQVFNRYGKRLKITYQIQGTKSEITRSIEFNDFTTLRRIDKLLPPTVRFHPKLYDPFHIKNFWRTKIKMYNECCICGETENVRLHHINTLASLQRNKKKKKKGKDIAAAIRSQLNRLQVPVCPPCHNDITYGKFSDPKKVIDFFNIFLAQL